MKKIKIIRSRPLKEVDDEVVDQALTNDKPEELTYESNPLEFILQKYPSLTATLVELLTEDFRDYLNGIYIMAPKPTVFKVVLHNNQYFYLTWMGKTYEAKVSGKKYWLSSIGELERATIEIANLLMLGAAPSTQGPEAEMTSAPEETPEEETPEEAPAEEEAPEEIQESKKKFKLNLLENKLQEAETGEAVLFESALVYAWYKLNKKPIPKDAILPAELEKLKSKMETVKKSAMEKAKKSAPKTVHTGGGIHNKTKKLKGGSSIVSSVIKTPEQILIDKYRKKLEESFKVIDPYSQQTRDFAYIILHLLYEMHHFRESDPNRMYYQIMVEIINELDIDSKQAVERIPYNKPSNEFITCVADTAVMTALNIII